MKNILSLGAGVQSSTVLLMSVRGVLPLLDAAIFSDTGWEPPAVYEYLKWLRVEAAKAGISVITTSQGNIRADALKSQVRGKKEDGVRWASMPMFTLSADGHVGMIRRQCTSEYKIAPVERVLKALVHAPRGCTEIMCHQYFGISAEEPQRMRDSTHAWAQNIYPLVDMRMTRHSCLEWIEKNNYPTPPRSACIGCPFHSNAEWSAIRSDPVMWKDAVAFDTAIRNCSGMRGQMFLHRSCRPLSEVDFRSDVERGQGLLDGFSAECTGMCGL